MKIKCNYCDNNTTNGIGDKSGFGHIKASVGKGDSKRKLNIYSCPEHSDNAYADLEKFFSNDSNNESTIFTK